MTDVFSGALVPKEGDTQAEIDAKIFNLKVALAQKRKQERPWPPVVTIANADRTQDYWEGFDHGYTKARESTRGLALKYKRLAITYILTGGRYGTL